MRQTRQDDRVLRVFSRTNDGIAVADGFKGNSAVKALAHCSAVWSTFLIHTRIAALWDMGRKPAARRFWRRWRNQIFKRLFDRRRLRASSSSDSGGRRYVPAPKFFLQELQRICRQHGIMLIADEVQSGMGRTGNGGLRARGIDRTSITSAKGLPAECRWRIIARRV